MRQELVSLVDLVFRKAEHFVVAVFQMLHILFLCQEINLIIIHTLIPFNKRKNIGTSRIVVSSSFGTKRLFAMLEIVGDCFMGVGYCDGVV